MREDIKAERARAAKQRRRIVTDPNVGPVCRVCQFGCGYVLHGHHIQSLAESTSVCSEIVYLCPNCHAMVHEIRRMRYAPHRMRVRNRADRLEQLEYWEDQSDKAVVAKLHDLARRSII